MNLSLSVAVAIALGTPGIGNVNTGLLPSQATEVFPTVITSAGKRCGLGGLGGRVEGAANGALALVFERHDQIVFLAASEHARIPGPVEKDCFQVLRTGCRGVQRRAASTSAAAGLSSTSGARTLATLSRRCRGSASRLCKG